MVKVDMCLIGAGFLGAMMMIHTIKFTENKSHEFKASLSEDQLKIHSSIVWERLTIYLQGMLLGMVLSMVFIKMYGKMLNRFNVSCVSSTIMMAVTYFYYMLKPKQALMVTHLTTPKQITLWNMTYREYQWRYYLGFVLGMLGYGFLNYGVVDLISN